MSQALQKGMRVNILVPMLPDIPKQGVIYGYCPSRPLPWHVRPDGWSPKKAGIAFKSEEISPVEGVQA